MDERLAQLLSLMAELGIQEVDEFPLRRDKQALGGPGFSHVQISKSLEVAGLKSGYPEDHDDAAKCDIRTYAGEGVVIVLAFKGAKVTRPVE